MAREPEKSGRESGKAKTEASEETKASAGKSAETAGENTEENTQKSVTLTEFREERRNELQAALAKRSQEEADLPAIVDEFAALWLPLHAVDVDMLVPALQDADVDDEKMAAVGVRKDMLNLLLADLLPSESDESMGAKLDVLAEQLDSIFEASRQEAEAMDEERLKALGPQMKARYERVKKRFSDIDESIREAMDLLAPRRLSLSAFRRQPRREAPGYSSRPDRDERGRYLPEEQRGYPRAGRRYEDEDEGRYGGRRSMGRYDEEDERRASRGRGRGGWYGDPQEHSEAARRGWERSGRGESGWYGDPEGHSQAARRGWEEGHRSQRRGEDDDRYRGRSRYEDEDRGYESRRGRYDDDDERYGRRGGRGGWSGDPEGHSEAARRGWEHRR
jgi:hypothetical protein